MKKLLSLTFALLVVVACGSKEEEMKAVEIAFPEAGMVDVMKIPAAKYRPIGVTSITRDTETTSKGIFAHTFKEPGNPENGDDVQRTTEWGNFDKGDKKLQLTMEVNLPYLIEASGEKVDFKEKHYYWNYVRSDDNWAWSASGGESPSGFRFHEFVKPENRSGDSVIYAKSETDSTLRITATVNGDIVSIFIERKTLKDGKEATIQIVELRFQKV